MTKKLELAMTCVHSDQEQIRVKGGERCFLVCQRNANGHKMSPLVFFGLAAKTALKSLLQIASNVGLTCISTCGLVVLVPRFG